MNAARLTRKWIDAQGDPTLMAEALVDEIDDPATGLVSRDFLRAELARLGCQLGTRIAELETRSLWRLISVFGVQIALVGVLVAVLVQVLR
jgi:hypothetical protein